MSHGRSKFDLVIVDVPKGLQVFHVSSPSELISSRNKLDACHIKVLLTLHVPILEDNACMHLIILEIKGMRRDVVIYPKTSKFTIKKDRWDINDLPLCTKA